MKLEGRAVGRRLEVVEEKELGVEMYNIRVCLGNYFFCWKIFIRLFYVNLINLWVFWV